MTWQGVWRQVGCEARFSNDIWLWLNDAAQGKLYEELKGTAEATLKRKEMPKEMRPQVQTPPFGE